MNIILKQWRGFLLRNRFIYVNAKNLSYKNTPNPGRSNLLKLLFGAGVISAISSAFYTYKRESIRPDELRQDKNKTDLSLRERFNFINKVVEKCAPAVVYVEIKDPKRIDKGTDNAMIVSNGSGFIVREDGWILTNAHVVVNKPNATIEVKLYDGSTYEATVEDADMNIDLALIKINSGRKLPALNLAKSGDVYVGEWVVALGSPLSLSHSATAGVVSSVNRAANELGLRNYQMRYIQTDAPITFGNSGGPLVNLDGDVIGINNLRITAGISFAIPIDYVTKFLDRIKFGSNRVAKEMSETLGITTITMTSEILKDVLSRYKSLGSDITHGVLVWKVVPASLGEKGGLQVGDIITHINGTPVEKGSDIYSFFTQNNKSFSLNLLRHGQKVNLTIQQPKK